MDTFKKRQKEMQRQERQRDKFARRMERKLHRASGGASPEEPAVEVPESHSEDQPATESGHAQ
jgi:hypothetical protein